MVNDLRRTRHAAELVNPADQKKREDWSKSDALFIDHWLERNPNEATDKVYRRAASKFGEWIKWKDLDKITVNDLQRFATYLRQPQLSARGRPPEDGRAIVLHEGDWTNSTIRKTLLAIKSLFSFASMSGHLSFNPGSALKVPRAEDHLAEKIVPQEKIRAVIAGEPIPLRRMLLRLCYFSGGRISEVLQLRWSECHAHKGSGVISFTQTKGGRPRAVRLPPEAWRDLISFRPATGDAFVFASPRGDDRPITAATAWHWIKAAGLRVGKPELSAHWFRHCHASHSLDRGAPVHVVQTTLGHASLTTTSRYAHARPGQSSGDYLKAVAPARPAQPRRRPLVKLGRRPGKTARRNKP